VDITAQDAESSIPHHERTHTEQPYDASAPLQRFGVPSMFHTALVRAATPAGGPGAGAVVAGIGDLAAIGGEDELTADRGRRQRHCGFLMSLSFCPAGTAAFALVNALADTKFMSVCPLCVAPCRSNGPGSAREATPGLESKADKLTCTWYDSSPPVVHRATILEAPQSGLELQVQPFGASGATYEMRIFEWPPPPGLTKGASTR
jgi:hypothetical protein